MRYLVSRWVHEVTSDEAENKEWSAGGAPQATLLRRCTIQIDRKDLSNFQASEIGPDFQVVFHGTEERSNVDSILRFWQDFL